MSLKFLILDTYYPAFLRTLYAREPHLSSRPYAAQWRALMDSCFGTADFYSLSLGKLGYEAEEVVANCNNLQLRWARENSPNLWAQHLLYRSLRRRKTWQLKVLAAQIDRLKPEVLYVQDLNWLEATLLREIRPRVRFIVGQSASRLRPDVDLSWYDLVLTSFPHYVERFRQQGLPAEYFRLAFEPVVLERLGPVSTASGTVFVGGFSPEHPDGTRVLESVAREVGVDFWGYGVETLSADSPVHPRYHGEAWGLEMYRVLAESRITLNRHGHISERYANNMRLYEATGAGTLLVTDMKDNLPEMFDPGREVIAYSDAWECAELVKYYLEHEDERVAIARAGQQRTLREHTYYQRMQELVSILERYLLHPEAVTRRVFPAGSGAR